MVDLYGEVQDKVENQGPAIGGEKEIKGGDDAHRFVFTCSCGVTHAVTVQESGKMNIDIYIR